MRDEESLPDHLRCRRNDGRQWRCMRRAMENKSFCEIHFLQARCRQTRRVVPLCIKLQRKSKYARNDASSAALPLSKNRKKTKVKKGDLRTELISMVLRRQIEKRKRSSNPEEKKIEVMSMRDLPNGLMAISGSHMPNFGHAFTPCEKKLEVEKNVFYRRCIRSKNVEPVPMCGFQVVPHTRNLARTRGLNKSCHQCGKSGITNLVACLRCEKEFYCKSCIKKWYSEMSEEEIKVACPLCRAICNCKKCSHSEPKDTGCKGFAKDLNKIDKILDAHYMICLLLPVLKAINRDQRIELEIEAKIDGKTPSGIQLKQAECGCDEKLYCDNCKASILDFHRSCSNCSFDLCLSCCREIRAGKLQGGIGAVTSDSNNKEKGYAHGSGPHLAINHMSHTVRLLLPEWKVNDSHGAIPCPPKELGGCGTSYLRLRHIFPLNWIQELETNAEEIACSYDFSELLDVSCQCPFCVGSNGKGEGCNGNLRVAATREDSDDNFLYCPSAEDILAEGIEHFQKHWIRGQPVIVRNVLENKSDLSGDPLVMFQSFLERYKTNDVKMVNATDCLDWCEVEIEIQQFFEGYLEGRTHRNLWPEMLKLRGWPPSDLFQEQMPTHHSQLVRALPFQGYTNPNSGLFNLAVKLPKAFPRPDLGPHFYISYGTMEELGRGDSVTKLHYEESDVVNVLTHTTEVVIPPEQLSKIEMLKRRHMAEDRREMDRKVVDEVKQEPFFGGESLEKAEISRADSKFEENESGHRWNKMFIPEEYRCGVKHPPYGTLSCENFINGETAGQEENRGSSLGFNSKLVDKSRGFNSKLVDKSRGVQWDVFRREDVPKLEAYLKEHFNEFRHTHCSPVEQVAHPIHDQSFFLDKAHKRMLKEEFHVEPWTFDQNLGEAVIVPAGCPYQLRNIKSCTNVGMDFVSPESAPECIQLIDELRLLPNNHKAKEDKIEVKKMVIYGINAAVEEIRRLTSSGMMAMETEEKRH